MSQPQEALENRVKISPETGPFFLGRPKALKPHLQPDGTECERTVGIVIEVEQYGFYNQKAAIKCACGNIQTQST